MSTTHTTAILLTVIKKMMVVTLLLIAGYLTVGYLFHLVVFPEVKPDISNYFKPGQVFTSEAEGFRQTVVKQEGGMVYCTLEIAPYASGPPMHLHTDFDEPFEVEHGVLSLTIQGEIKKLYPGEKILIPRGTAHKPFNETADTVRIKGAIAFPEAFAFSLVQVYGLMDHHPDFGTLPATLFMLAPMHQVGFDSYLAEGPPVVIQKILSFLLTPAARLMGYKSFYTAYDISK